MIEMHTLVQYYPLQLLIGRSDCWVYALYPLGTVFFLASCYAFWRFGVRRYTSAGSYAPEKFWMYNQSFSFLNAGKQVWLSEIYKIVSYDV